MTRCDFLKEGWCLFRHDTEDMMVFSEKWPGVQGAAVGPLAGSRGRAPCGGHGATPPEAKVLSNFNPQK